MSDTIIHRTSTENGTFWVHLTTDSTEATVYRGSTGYVAVQNVRRCRSKIGRTFDSYDDALRTYRSRGLRAAIAAARALDEKGGAK